MCLMLCVLNCRTLEWRCNLPQSVSMPSSVMRINLHHYCHPLEGIGHALQAEKHAPGAFL
jgi:hypothetical protein